MCLQQYCLLQACGLIFVAGVPLQIEDKAGTDLFDDTATTSQETVAALEDLAAKKEVKKRPAAKDESRPLDHGICDPSSS